MQSQENRPIQSLETSMKFNSWSTKGMDEKLGTYLPQICEYLQSISRSLAVLAKTPAPGKTSADDDIPF